MAIEKVNPSHPDKVADRIAGALVDLAYKKNENARIAVEVLIGHGEVNIIIETTESFDLSEVQAIVDRITGTGLTLNLKVVPQDVHLADNQANKVRCGDNGIFKGVPLTDEEVELSRIAREIYAEFPTDGKYILDSKGKKLIVCQSCATDEALRNLCTRLGYPNAIINPLGEWTGGPNVDSGATNRKLGSDMAQSVTGGGLSGKDLTKADVSVNIYAFVKAQQTNKPVSLCCAIGDDTIDGKPYKEIVDFAKDYIDGLGGFEAFSEWGLY